MAIHILIADDHEMVRYSLEVLLEDYPDLVIVGMVTNGYEALEFVAHTPPDIVLMDINMPELDGLQATQQLHQLYPRLPIIILTASLDPEILAMAREAGAALCLRKNTGGEKLCQAIHDTFKLFNS